MVLSQLVGTWFVRRGGRTASACRADAVVRGSSERHYRDRQPGDVGSRRFFGEGIGVIVEALQVVLVELKVVGQLVDDRLANLDQELLPPGKLLLQRPFEDADAVQAARR